MKAVSVIALITAFTVGGFAVGWEYSKVREHIRLERNKALVRASHEKVWNETNNDAALAMARQIYARDFILHNPAGGSEGLDAFLEILKANRADFPDWSESIESMVAEGDLVAVRFASRGTQGRDLSALQNVQPAIPNRGKTIHIHEMEVFRISEDKLAEQWDLWDGWDINSQLGLFDADNWRDSVCREN